MPPRPKGRGIHAVILMKEKRPKIGVATIVIENGNVLLGQRKNAHGEGLWAPPGGHLEYKETIEQCAIRELKEETGLQALELKTLTWTENLIEEHHYITFFVIITKFEGLLQPLEPHKCSLWSWFKWDNLPSPLFSPFSSFHANHRNLSCLQ